MCFFVLLCEGIREQTEIKQSVSKLTEEVSADSMLLIHDDGDDDDMCSHICHKALIVACRGFVCFSAQM